MNLIELPESLILDALKQPETGMGYQIAAVLLPSGYRDEGGYLLGGAFFLRQSEIPATSPFRVSQTERLVFADLSQPIIEHASHLAGHATIAVSPKFSATTRSGSSPGEDKDRPPFETRTTASDVFFRLTAFREDRRIGKDGSVVPGTYTTTDSDYTVVPSGLAAVGRYALPSRLPASHVFVIQPPPGTPVAYGTVSPNFGMSGGGVEAYFPRGCPAGSAKYHAMKPMK